MKIRTYKADELDRLVNIWYEGSLLAHDFIEQNYWKSQQKAMRETYLPMAETYVITEENKVVGFISMVDNYLAALFVDYQYQGKGYGKRLLHFIKEKREQIDLKVYQKNKRAVSFYLKNGFELCEELFDELTVEKEFLMKWKR
ncbi:N-acetyltransferase [Virgibacillus proomii]|jgi:putative acetyltransferase|uniref:N-acetyltransferase n=1 Tax=Virgibacillus proomii TaxID=84407 RepID=UPI0009868842|nr:N-acetyltransferase [Virgibacillus proomii]